MFRRFKLTGKKNGHDQPSMQDEIAHWSEFQRWYTTNLGKQFAKSEKAALDSILPDLFGYYLLQCGCPEIELENSAYSWVNSSRVSTRFSVDYFACSAVSFQAYLPQLPVQSDSVDVVVLPHVLDFSLDPHQVLREVERVLIAEGHVVILGFNPWSLWNVFRLFFFWKKQPPWTANFFTATRVMDWLSLLGFDVVQRKGYYYKLPIQHRRVARKLGFIEKLGRRFWKKLGAGYVLVARKRVETLTPIRPKWRKRPQVVSPGLETLNRNKL